MPIPGVPEPQGGTGGSDWWYRRGEVPYPIARSARSLFNPQLNPQSNTILAAQSIIVGVNVTFTYTSANGATPQVSPDSALQVVLPSLALVIYYGHYIYDLSNPAANTSATVYRAVRVNGAIQSQTQSLLYNVPNGKVLESVPNSELFYEKVQEVFLLDPGSYTIDHVLFVNNASTSLTGGNLQVVYSDRAWVAWGHFALRAT